MMSSICPSDGMHLVLHWIASCDGWHSCFVFETFITLPVVFPTASNVARVITMWNEADATCFKAEYQSGVTEINQE